MNAVANVVPFVATVVVAMDVEAVVMAVGAEEAVVDEEAVVAKVGEVEAVEPRLELRAMTLKDRGRKIFQQLDTFHLDPNTLSTRHLKIEVLTNLSISGPSVMSSNP